jgi:hypothetical protein
MHNLVVGTNQLSNVASVLVQQQPVAQVAGNEMTVRNPVEIVGALNLQNTCTTGDITWRVAQDVMSGWLCDWGTWKLFGQ